MTTLEKLFVQIFERKDWIIDQVQQQADSYSQQLASTLLIDGITPPPWLLNPSPNSHSSDPNELEKEEIISKLLLRPPRDSVPYPSGGRSLYYQSVVTGGNGRLSNATCMETYAPNKGLNLSNEPTVTLDCHNNDIGCSLNHVSEQDDSVSPPQNETDARISSIYAAPDASLARIQRSRSRQKARELRTNVKTAAKSCLSNENRTSVSFTGALISKIDFHQVTQDNCSSELYKCNDISKANSVAAEDEVYHGRTTRSRSSSQQPSGINKSSKLGKSASCNRKEGSDALPHSVGDLMHGLDTSNKVLDALENRTSVYFTEDLISKIDFHQVTQDNCSSEVYNCNDISKTNSVAAEGEVYHGRTTRSRSSSQQPSGINKSSKLGKSASCNPKEGRDALPHSVGDLMHGLDASNKVLDGLETSQALNNRIGEARASCSNEGVLKPIISSNMAAPHVRGSRSGSLKESTVVANHQENADFVVGNGHIDAPVAKHSASSGIKLDLVTICTNSEGLTSKQRSLRGYAAKTSIAGKTQDTQRHSKVYCGRITRSRSSTRQTSGINSFSELGTSASCHPKEGRDALPHSRGDLMHGLDASNKVLDALETSQALNDRIGETRIGTNEGVLKPVNSSNIAVPQVTRSRSGSLKESTIGANHKENAEIVAGNAPIDAPVAKQSVSSGNKLDLVTLCTKSEGVASRQPSVCCMKVKPKQLNFDETGECDLIEICCPLAKKRKLDGLSGQECSPSNESASSIENKSTSPFVEQELPTTNDSSRNLKVERSHSHDDFDEGAKDEMNIGLDMNGNPVVQDVEQNSEVSPHYDIAVSCQGDLGHKGEKSAAGVYVPVSKDTNTSFVSSLTKQGNNDLKDCLDKKGRMPEQDLGSSKSKELEVWMNPKFSNMKLNSVEVNTWPGNQQRNVKAQSNCFSDPRGFRLHIKRDAIHCDLEASENDLHCIQEAASVPSSGEIHVSESDVIQSCNKRVHDGMTCDLQEGTESLHELQAAEATTTEVDDDTTETAYALKQSGSPGILNLFKNAASLSADAGAANQISNDDVACTNDNNLERSLPEWVSNLETNIMSTYDIVRSSPNDDKTVVGSDEIMPVYEGFVIDEEVGNERMENAEGGVDFDTVEIPSTTIARASILEQICKSASMQTPLSEFSSTFQQHTIPDLYGFMADGLLEHMDPLSTVSLDEDCRKHLRASASDVIAVDSTFPKLQKIDLLPFSCTPFCWESKNHYSSPVGKLWERSASSSGSSEMQLSSNPELTCFPIEEDPSSNDESEHAEEVSDELRENIGSRAANDLVEIEPPTEPTVVCFQNPVTVSTEMEIPRKENDGEVLVIQEAIVSRAENDFAERESPPESTEACSQYVDPVPISMKYYDRCSSNSINIELSVPDTHDKVKHKPKNHPGSKVSRFEVENRISSVSTSGRGNVSLKNKSNMRSGIHRVSQKEAKRNNIVSNITSFIPMVQQKQAAAVCTGKRDIKVKALEAAEAAKRREQERENERKMKKEAFKLERARIEKENARELELKKKKKQEEQKKKEADMAARKRQREEDERKQNAKKRKPVADPRKDQKLQHEKSQGGKVEAEKQHDKNATSMLEKSPAHDGSVRLTSQEISYDISPYRSDDDDDDEDEDELRTKKFVPSWASKSCVAIFLPLQQEIDPETIFPAESFCSMGEVLLPRRVQAR